MRLLPILLAMASPAVAQQPEPAVGDIFDISPGERFRGWILQASGLSNDGQSYAVFEKNGRLLLVLTKPLVRGAAGGIEVEKITHVRLVSKSAAEEVLDGHDCSFLGMAPIVSLFNKQTKAARGVFATRNGFEERRWLVDDPMLCQNSVD